MAIDINIPKPVIDYNDLENLPTLVTQHSQLTLDDGTNPHGTTKSDVGLSDVDNTSDVDKPISTATQTALDLKADITSISTVGFSNDYNDLNNKPIIPTVLDKHSQLTLDDGTNPHGTTKTDIGLSNVPNLDTTNAVNKAHDAVTLTGTPDYLTIAGQTITRGLIDLANHVIGRLGFSNLPTGTARSVVGRSGSGNGNLENISAGNNTILGRSGSGDIAFNNASETKEILSLENVDNTSDLNKPISTATQTALDSKQPTLVSGTNIKTINGNSLLGSGDISTAAVNPTSGVIPYNNGGVFADSGFELFGPFGIEGSMIKYTSPFGVEVLFLNTFGGVYSIGEAQSNGGFIQANSGLVTDSNFGTALIGCGISNPSDGVFKASFSEITIGTSPSTSIGVDINFDAVRIGSNLTYMQGANKRVRVYDENGNEYYIQLHTI